jgi:hypothetical protein
MKITSAKVSGICGKQNKLPLTTRMSAEEKNKM